MKGPRVKWYPIQPCPPCNLPERQKIGQRGNHRGWLRRCRLVVTKELGVPPPPRAGKAVRVRSESAKEGASVNRDKDTHMSGNSVCSSSLVTQQMHG